MRFIFKKIPWQRAGHASGKQYARYYLLWIFFVTTGVSLYPNILIYRKSHLRWFLIQTIRYNTILDGSKEYL